MFNHARVARWSVIAGLINTAASARCFFIHEYAIGAWLGLIAVLMGLQFSMAGARAEESKRGG